MIAHFSSLRKTQYNRAWAPTMNLIAGELKERGYTITKDATLMWWREPDGIEIGSSTNADIVFYTDFTHDSYQQKGYYVGLQGPEPGYFSIDRVGVWPHLEQTYKAPTIEFIESNHYWNEYINLCKIGKVSHYHNDKLNLGKNSPAVDVPDNHILILLTGSEGPWNAGKWERTKHIMNKLIAEDYPIVVKYDPRFLLKSDGTVDPDKLSRQKDVIENLSQNLTVITGLESLHDILPKSRVCIMDEELLNLEPFMYNVPIITHSSPPYRHYVKQIVHEHELIPAIRDTSWHDFANSYTWLQWYCNDYLCRDNESVIRRFDQLGL